MEKAVVEEYGTRVERGRVIDVGESGARVASLSRAGIVTPPIASMVDHRTPLTIGQTVYFFLFEDGEGCIIGHRDGRDGG